MRILSLSAACFASAFVTTPMEALADVQVSSAEIVCTRGENPAGTGFNSTSINVGMGVQHTGAFIRGSRCDLNFNGGAGTVSAMVSSDPRGTEIYRINAGIAAGGALQKVKLRVVVSSLVGKRLGSVFGRYSGRIYGAALGPLGYECGTFTNEHGVSIKLSAFQCGVSVTAAQSWFTLAHVPQPGSAGINWDELVSAQ